MPVSIKLAEEYARQITPETIGGAVLKDAQEFLKSYERQRDTAIHIRELLDELAAKLTDEAKIQQLQPLRSVLLEELHPDTLNRLEPFLKAENDAGYEPTEKLALGYSGWVVGAANAVTDLDQAVRLWDTRFLIQEAMRAPTPNDRQLIYQQMRRVEGIGPDTVRKLIPQIPPVIETPDIQPGRVHKIEVPADDPAPATTYSVLLPIEYSPHHSYPLLITLRAQDKTVEQTLLLMGRHRGAARRDSAPRILS